MLAETGSRGEHVPGELRPLRRELTAGSAAARRMTRGDRQDELTERVRLGWKRLRTCQRTENNGWDAQYPMDTKGDPAMISSEWVRITAPWWTFWRPWRTPVTRSNACWRWPTTGGATELFMPTTPETVVPATDTGHHARTDYPRPGWRPTPPDGTSQS